MAKIPAPKKSPIVEGSSVSLKDRFGGGGSSDGRERRWDWATAIDSDLVRVVAVVVRAGCAVMLGVTRDGGAGVLTLFNGDEKLKWYPATADELAAALRDVEWGFLTTDERRKRGWLARADAVAGKDTISH